MHVRSAIDVDMQMKIAGNILLPAQIRNNQFIIANCALYLYSGKPKQ